MVDATVDVGVGAFERGVGIEWHWIGNRPVQPRKGVAEFFVGVVADRDDEVVVMKDVVEGFGRLRSIRRPWRSATATARGWMRGPGWVPAEVAGMMPRWFQVAAASWERAEFAVHTNTTRGTACRLVGMRPEIAAAQTVGWSSRSWT